MFKLRSLMLLASLSLFGCGKELGRVPFTAEGEGQTEATLAAGDVDFWTDIDIDLKGPSGPEYKIELLQGGKSVGSTSCNPMGHMSIKKSWVSTDLGDDHSRRGEGKMDCSLKLASGGPTTIKVKLFYPKKPPSVTLKKADLIVKQ